MQRTALALAALITLAAFTGDNPPPDARQHAVLWFATAAENEACFLQGYAAASGQLLMRGPAKSRQAIVTDLDETALNNAAWSARRILKADDFPKGWPEWEKAGNALALPGAVPFFKLADSLGYRICYLSNRYQGNLAGTLKNLKALGFPQADSAHTPLKPSVDGPSTKEPRRQALRAQGYEIVMLLGDNLSDFVNIPSSAPEKQRADSVRLHRGDWGRRFIVFPNPMYGNWLGALTPKGSESRAAIDARMKALAEGAE